MFNTTDSLPRADISSVLMEAMGQENLYVGQSVLPIYPSGKEIGRYPKFRLQSGELRKNASNLVGTTKRNETGTYNEVSRKFEWDTFQTEEFGLEERVDDVVARRMESFFDAEVVTAKLLMNNLMLDYEVAVAAVINNPSTFTATHASVTYTEANILTLDVPADISAIVERLTLTGEPPVDAVMSLSVWNRLRRSKLLQTYVYGYLNVSQGGSMITENMFAQAMGLRRILIAKQSYDTALKGKAATLVPIWGNDYIFVGRFAEGDFMNGGVGRTIIWDADSPGGLWTSESYRDEKRRGNMLRVRSNRTLKVINALAGQLIDTGFDGSFAS